jgi:hypothetical protein
VFDLATGKEYQRIQSSMIAFAPNGQMVASWSGRTAHLWKVQKPTVSTEPSNEELERNWKDLSNEDAGRAFNAIGALAAVPRRALPLLEKKTFAARGNVDAKRLERLIADLDSNRFATREQASKEIEKMGIAALPTLREHLKQPTLLQEARRRMERLIEAAIAQWDFIKGKSTASRLTMVLEHVGTPEARALLKKLAEQYLDTPLGYEARASLERMER